MNSSIKDISVKHSLGKLIVLFGLLQGLYGEDFTAHLHATTHTPYVKEPVYLSVEFNQTNPVPVLLFQFGITPSKAYEIHQIYAHHDDTLHHTHHQNLYLIYPLQAGDINVTFSFVKRVTNDEKVRYFASGDRDDFKKLDTTDYTIALAPLQLHVKALPKNTQLVGEFTLHHTLKTKEAKAYEPIPLQVTIAGKGYPPVIPDLIPPSKTFTLFSQPPHAQIRHTQKGTECRVIYAMAVSAPHSFTLPQTTLHAFNPRTQRRYTLTIPPEPVTVTPVDKRSLVDRTDTPEPLQPEGAWIGQLLGYLSAFVAGFATAWLIKQRRNTIRTQPHPLNTKIEASADAKALLALLLAQNDRRFKHVIEKLEAVIYGKQSYTLNSLKQEAKEQL